MQRNVKVLACGGFVLALIGLIGSPMLASPQSAFLDLSAARFGAQVDGSWTQMVSDAKGSTSNKSAPATVAAAVPTSTIKMSSYTGVVLMAQYDAAQTLTTDPVVRVYGLKGSRWISLKDSDGNRAITLSDDTADPVSADASYKYTITSEFIDAKGCEQVVVCLDTAAASSGAVTIWGTRY